MKKRIISLGLAGLMLTSLLSGCHDQNDLAQIASLQAENASLTAAVANLKAELRALESSILSDWHLTAEPLEDGSGATVRFEAEAMGTKSGQSAHFVVMLEDKTVVDLPCAFDGSHFTASAQLDAQNGYTFFCDLSDGQSEPIRYALLNPADETLPLLMNLHDSMNTYATLLVDSWKVKEGEKEEKEAEEEEEEKEEETEEDILIVNADVQVQLSSFTANHEKVSVESAALHFTMGETVLESLDITLDGTDSALSADMKGITCPIPKDMPTDAQLTLRCEIKLSDGNTLTADGGSWFMQDGQLQMVAG